MTLKITSIEALEAAVADTVRLKIKFTQHRAEADAEIARVEKAHQNRLGKLAGDIADAEATIQAYCHANRGELFPDKKSRETALAVFGFEMTPPRVETTSRKIRLKDVVERLLRLPWGKAYLRTPEPSLDRTALLADRERLTPEQLGAAGVQFCQDEQFFLRPKPETAQLSD